MNKKLVLASQSPRRRELMAYLPYNFETDVAQIEEVLDQSLGIQEQIEKLSYLKAAEVYKRHQDKLVLACDTVVVLDGFILGKPKDKEDAGRMLHLLSGKEHEVISSVTLISSLRSHSFSNRTKVSFYPLSDKEISDYIASGEPMDKAGAYGIQGLASLFIKGIEGDFFSVMGLPIAEIYHLLKEEEW